jgi:hypothetical protein
MQEKLEKGIVYTARNKKKEQGHIRDFVWAVPRKAEE